MFRKIHSKREPGATLPGELQKEFGQYLANICERFRAVLNRYPFAVFSLMICCMLLSGVLAFTVLRQQKRPVLPKLPVVKRSPAAGMPDAVSAYEAFKEAALLQSRIEAIAQKDTLTVSDSIQVVDALKRIDAIRQQFKTQ